MPFSPQEDLPADVLDRPLTPREREAVIYRIKSLMQYHGITVAQLARAPASKPPRPPAPNVKYRHPKTGETWNGIGEHPPWLRHALLKEGYRVDELRPDDPPRDTD